MRIIRRAEVDLELVDAIQTCRAPLWLANQPVVWIESLMAYIAYQTSPSFGPDGNWRRIAHEWKTLAEANAYDGEHEVPEVTKDTAREYSGHVGVGNYVNIVTHAVAVNLPADNSAAAQRAEIEAILRQEYYRFNRRRFEHADNATNRPIFATIDKRTQFLYAALPLNSSNAALDKLKTEARVLLDEFAYSADMSAWADAFDGGSFYAFVKGATEESVTLPAADAAVTSPTSTQVSAVSLADKLG